MKKINKKPTVKLLVKKTTPKIEPQITETNNPVSLKKRILDEDIDNFIKIANSCKNEELVIYEVHVLIEDAIKKILNTRKDHGL